MATYSRRMTLAHDPLGGGFAGAFVLHGAAFALIIGWAYIFHSGQRWGSQNATAGAIQATMVTALPLPSKQPVNTENVLATEAPSPAPVEAKPKTVEAPKPDAIAILKPNAKPVKTADVTTPTPPLHPQNVKVDPAKAQTGDATGVRIAMSSDQNKAGTFSVGVTDAGFGTRFAFYNDQIRQKLEAQWYVGMLDSQAAGHKVSIAFQVERDGTPTHIQIAQPSGDSTLDQTSLRAVQHIDTFGPLPDGYRGSYVNVQYYFEAPPRP
jgi:periplasmic protein TonB